MDMKTCNKKSFAPPVLVTVIGLLVAGRVTAQSVRLLHSFPASSSNSFGIYTNSEGTDPKGLILSGNTLYGTAYSGGNSAIGTVFAVNTDGTGFRTLHSFTALSNFFMAPYNYTNSDGAWPSAGLVLSNSTLYGTASEGGDSGNGTVFAVNTDGTGFRTVHTFTQTSDSLNGTNSDGAWPTAGLILSGDTLYGTASQGGTVGYGTVFKLNSDGTGFTTLHSFTLTSTNSSGVFTNGDGATPNGLVASSDSLYGTTQNGGSSGNGTVFKVNRDGTGFTNLHSFAAGAYDYSLLLYTNSDGTGPCAVLVLSGNRLYGRAFSGGSLGGGAVFAINIDGTAFETLYSFSSTKPASQYGLVLAGDTLYGMTTAVREVGIIGTNYYYAVGNVLFAIRTDGTGFTETDPLLPLSGGFLEDKTVFPDLILSGKTFYAFGGLILFSRSFAPKLTANPSGANLILSWPTNYAGFDYTGYRLQSATNLASPVWTTNLPASVVVDGQNTVTNPISVTHQFFRLIQ
jgi:uncharacterized repeat protein (TIGR03803 family)